MAAQVLGVRDFRLYLGGRFFAAAALQMQSVAIGWYLYDLTGDPMVLGYAGLSVFVPIALFTLPGGDIADRADRRLILGGAHFVQALCAAVLVFLAAFRVGEAWPFYGVLALSGTARAFSQPAVSSFLPFLVRREQFPAAVAWSSSANKTATVLGPALGGLAYLAGPQAAFAACMAASLCVATAMLSIRTRGAAHAPGEAGALARAFEGLRYVRRQRHPARRPRRARMLRSSFAAGAVLAGVALAQLAAQREPHAGRALFAGVALFGAAALVFGASENVALSVAALAVMGAADMVSVFVRSSVVQLATPDAMRGRVSAVHALFVGASNELGDFRAGAMAAWLGAVPAVLAGGVCTLAVVGVWAWRFPGLRAVRRLSEVQPG